MPVAKKPVETKPVEVAKEVPKEAAPVPPVDKKAPAKGRTAKVQPETKVVAKKEEVVETPVVPAASDDKDAPVANVEDPMKNLHEKIVAVTALFKEIQAGLKSASRDYDKLKKVVDKIQKKRENARKSPSGFAKPNKISDELCDFIGVPRGTEKSRTDITRYINSYVKEHNLNKPTNRRVILPDEKLKAILNVKEGEEVTFFILQRLISHHFPPKTTK
jgi:chromatin remodeling complex protein RSC6